MLLYFRRNRLSFGSSRKRHEPLSRIFSSGICKRSQYQNVPQQLLSKPCKIRYKSNIVRTIVSTPNVHIYLLLCSHYADHLGLWLCAGSDTLLSVKYFSSPVGVKRLIVL